MSLLSGKLKSKTFLHLCELNTKSSLMMMHHDSFRARRSGKHTFSGLAFGGGRVKRKSLFTVKVDPLTPLDIPLDDHIDTLTPDANMYVGVTTFSKEPDKKVKGNQQGITK